MAGKSDGKESCPTAQKVDEAVAKQQDLLAEFEKIADELNRVLANLEGSTLLKRLKAASRHAVQHRRPDDRPGEPTPSAARPHQPTRLRPKVIDRAWPSKRPREARTSR